jgi:hypothetical protein
VIELSSEPEEIQYIQAMHALEEFVKILVVEYPLVFKDGSGVIKIIPSTEKQFFPYEASISIRKKSEFQNRELQK